MKALFLLLLSCVFRFHAFGGFERLVERRIAEKNPGIQGVKVRIRASRLGFLFRGRIRLLHVEFHNIEVGALRIDRYITRMEGFRFAVGSTFFRGLLRVRSIDRGRWWINVDEKGIERFLKARGGVMSGASVTICHDGICIRRQAPIISLIAPNADICIIGTATIRGDADVHLDFRRAEFLSAPVNPILRAMAAVINPVITSERLDRVINDLKIDGFESIVSHVIIEKMRLGPKRTWIEGRTAFFTAPPAEEKPQPARSGAKSAAD